MRPVLLAACVLAAACSNGTHVLVDVQAAAPLKSLSVTVRVDNKGTVTRALDPNKLPGRLTVVLDGAHTVGITAVGSDGSGGALSATATVMSVAGKDVRVSLSLGYGGNVGDGGVGDGGNPSGPVISLLAGALGGAGNADGVGHAARVYGPIGIVVDNAGNAYVADSGNDTIRKIDSAGNVTTIAGTRGVAMPLYAPQGLALDQAGQLLYMGDGRGDVVQLDLKSGAITTLTNGILAISGLALDGKGNLYITQGEATFNPGPTGTVLQLSLGTGNRTTIASSLNWAQGIAYDGGNTLYVAVQNDCNIVKIDLANGNAKTVFAGGSDSSACGYQDGPATQARFGQSLTGLALDATKTRLYAADSCTVRAIDLSSPMYTVSTVAGANGLCGADDGAALLARFTNTNYLATDGAGGVYITDTNHTVRKLAGGQVTTLAGLAPNAGNVDGGKFGRFKAPLGIVADGNGTLYVADDGNAAIRRVSGNPPSITTLVTGAPLADPQRLALDGNYLYVTDAQQRVVRRLNLTTKAFDAAPVAGTEGMPGFDATHLSWPQGLSIDSSAHVLYIADRGNNAIRAVNLDSGAMTTVTGGGNSGTADGALGSASFNGPDDVKLASDGSLYVADTFNHAIRRIVLSGVDAGVYTVAGTKGTSGSSDGSANALFFYPDSLAFDASGNLWVAEGFSVDNNAAISGNCTVRKVVLGSPAVVSTYAGAPNAMGAGKAGVVLGALPGQLNVIGGIAALPNRLVLSVPNENALLQIQ